MSAKQERILEEETQQEADRAYFEAERSRLYQDAEAWAEFNDTTMGMAFIGDAELYRRQQELNEFYWTRSAPEVQAKRMEDLIARMETW